MDVHTNDGFELIVRQADREFLGSQTRRQPDKPFYHYTNAGGLTGILETHTIWATEYGKLNDPDELTRREKAIQSELKVILGEEADDTARGHLARLVEKARRGNGVIDMQGIQIFVASFSSDGNLLGQWCRYADDAAGYAIGFNSVPLPTAEESASDLHSELAVDFGPCVYSEEDFRTRVRTTLFYIADGLEKYLRTYCRTDEQVQRINKAALVCAMAKLGSLVFFLKDLAFADEKEWRLVQIGTPPERLTRPTRYGDASYTKVALQKPDRMHLHEVITGPRVKDVDFARSTLDRCGYGDVAITRSRLSYR